jgi:hypothetical protein
VHVRRLLAPSAAATLSGLVRALQGTSLPLVYIFAVAPHFMPSHTQHPPPMEPYSMAPIGEQSTLTLPHAHFHSRSCCAWFGMHQSLQFTGIVRSCYKEKFGIPRQPGDPPSPTLPFPFLLQSETPLSSPPRLLPRLHSQYSSPYLIILDEI